MSLGVPFAPALPRLCVDWLPGSECLITQSECSRNMFDFEGMADKVDVEVMIAIGGGLLIASFFLMCCFLCLYCKLASALRKL